MVVFLDTKGDFFACFFFIYHGCVSFLRVTHFALLRTDLRVCRDFFECRCLVLNSIFVNK